MTIQLGDYEIDTVITGGAWCENCYIVRHVPSDEQILIDPGDDADRIVDVVLKKQDSLKYIFITHGHHDHVGAVSVLNQRFGAPCYLHKADARLMRQSHMYALVFDGKKIEPFTSACLFDDEKSLEIGKQQIQVIYTPGHTSGSSCYFFGDFVFTGDTILFQNVGRTDTPGADKDQLKSSVTCLMEKLPLQTVIFPGHGRAWTIGEARDWWQNAAASPPQYKRFGAI